MTSPSTPLQRAEAALAVHRRVTYCYQEANRKLVQNLTMLGRGDVAKTILSDLLKQVTLAGGELSAIDKVATTTQGTDDDDDDLA